MKLIKKIENNSFDEKQTWLLNNKVEVSLSIHRKEELGVCYFSVLSSEEMYKTYTMATHQYLNEKLSQNYENTPCIGYGLIKIPLQDLRKVLLTIEQADISQLESDQLITMRYNEKIRERQKKRIYIEIRDILRSYLKSKY